MAATVILLSLFGVFIQAENWYDQIGLSAIKSVNPVYWADDYVLFTIYQTSFAPARKPYRIGLMFTHKNSDFSAIFVTKRSCNADLERRPSHIGYVCAIELAFRDRSGKTAQERGLDPLRRIQIFKSEDWASRLANSLSQWPRCDVQC